MRIDCRHFTGSVPCAPHKLDERECERCDAYEAVSQRVLIVKLGAAGDVLRTTSILPALRAMFPRAQITWVTEGAWIPLLEGNSLVDRIIARDRALERLLVEHFDVVFGLDPDEDGAAVASLARAPRRAGFILDDRGRVQPANDAARLWWMMGLDDGLKRSNRRTHADILYELCGLAPPVAAPQFVVPAEQTAAMRRALGDAIARFHDAVVLNTGGGSRWEQKKWTVDHYREFVRLLRQAHPDCAVIVTGGPEESAANAALLASTRDEGVIDGGCHHSLKAFGALLSMGGAVVTSDSLAVHMANALEVPVLALVGPTSPWELDVGRAGEVVHADVPCIACYQRRCPLSITCMNLLTPEYVLNGLEHVMQRKWNAPHILRPVKVRPAPSAGGQQNSRA